jgi:putative DNA primase/helicase
MSAPILKAALRYGDHGLFVFPAPPGAKRSYKSALRSGGSRWGATKDAKVIQQDFTRWPFARIGIPTGIENGIVVVETDTVKGHGVDGAAALAELQAKHGPLPETLQAISPSGSVHRYLKHPGIKIKNSASELGPGIDVRGDGGMVIAPPSVTPEVGAYRWLNRSPIAAMPEWLVELTRDKPLTISQRATAAIRPPSSCGTTNAYGAAALESEIRLLAAAPDGGRNHALNRTSFRLHQLVAGGELDAGEVEQRLIDATIANGLMADRGNGGMRNVMATIRSGARAGLQHPRSRGPR